MIKSKKNLPLFLMITVIVPGLVISVLGIYFVSQQKNARELNLRRDLNEQVIKVRDGIENKYLQLVKNVFKQVSESKITFKNNNVILKYIKDLVLKNPIVKYPFFINPMREFVFPISRKPVISTAKVPDLAARDENIKDTYNKGRNLELRERKFVNALNYYLECLNKNPHNKIKPYIYNSIARCYFKLGRFFQALYYYKIIIRNFKNYITNDKFFYFTVLRQIALSYKLMELNKKALRIYLNLYEEILEYETVEKSVQFQFFKNEALDYLNLHVKDSEQERTRFNQAKAIDKLKKATELDITLRWLYFDIDTFDREFFTQDGSQEGFRFLKLQELYTSNDEKTLFYKDIKKLPYWVKLGNVTMNIKSITNPVSNDVVDIIFQKIPKNNSRDKNIFFGFMLSEEFLKAKIFPEIVPENLNNSSLKLFILDDIKVTRIKQNSLHPIKLFSMSFDKILSNKTLTLYSSRRDYFKRQVQGEIWINYGLIVTLILTLTIGVFLFYKYISREAELVRLKSDFVSSASHTLKTPLTRMALLAENLSQGWVSDEEKKSEFINTIIQETGRMNEMVNNMLNFSRIEAGKKQYEFKKAFLQKVVGTFIDQYFTYVKNSGFELISEIKNDLPSLLIDAEAIKLVLVNLVQNAIKYSFKEKYIRIRLYKNKDFAVIEVEDRGMGISERDCSKIFDKFYRVENSTVKVLEGSGLGLFLVRHAVRAHHGEVRVKSCVGKGSTFTVFLPINKKDKGK